MTLKFGDLVTMLDDPSSRMSVEKICAFRDSGMPYLIRKSVSRDNEELCEDTVVAVLSLQDELGDEFKNDVPVTVIALPHRLKRLDSGREPAGLSFDRLMEQYK